MNKIEEMRQKLGVKQLGSDKRSGMLKDFKDVGGKVVDVKDDATSAQYSKLGKAIHAQKEAERDRILREEDEKRRKEQEKEARMRKMSQISQNPAENEKKQKDTGASNHFWDYALSKLNCYSQGITALFKNAFTDSFYALTLTDLRNTLLTCKKILASLLYQDKSITAKVKGSMSATTPETYYELIYRFENIFDDALFKMIADTRSLTKPVQGGLPAFMKLFKKLVVLKPYAAALQEALNAALAAEAVIRGIGSEIAESNIRFLRNHLDFIFRRYYPKILSLMDYYFKWRRYEGSNESWVMFIQPDPSEQIGYLTRIWKEEEAKELIRRREEEEREKRDEEAKNPWDKLGENAAISLKNGLKMIVENIDFGLILDELRAKNDPWGLCEVNDRGFLIYILIDIFDRDFSFLFASAQVHYDIFIDKNGVKNDVRAQLRDAYYQLEGIYQRSRNYIKAVQQMQAILEKHPEQEKAVNLNPELKHLVTYREDALRLMLVEARKYFEQFIEIFHYFMKDDFIFKQMIRNGEDMLNWENKVARLIEKSNVSIREVLQTAYAYLSVFQFLLVDGDLNTYTPLIKKPKYLKLPIKEEAEDTEEDEGESTEAKTERSAPTRSYENASSEQSKNPPTEQSPLLNRIDEDIKYLAEKAKKK